MLKSKWIVMIVLTLLSSLNYGVAQEQDLQGLDRPSLSSQSPTTSPGISINSSLVSDANNAAISRDSIQDKTIVGSFGDDRITGSNESDIIIGLLGADTIRGNSGDDKIQGNEDIDKLYGEDGNDLLQGGAATDQLYGGIGADYFHCGEGIDIVIDFNLEEGDDNAGNCEEMSAVANR